MVWASWSAQQRYFSTVSAEDLATRWASSNAVGCPLVAATSDVYRHAARVCFTHAVAECAAPVSLTAIENLVNTKRTHDSRETANMIAMRN